MRTVSDDEIKRTVREIVSERPDYVYERPDDQPAQGLTNCFYVHGDGPDATPGCLVGTALHRLGVPLDELRKYEGKSASSVAPRFFSMSIDAIDFLDEVQSEQDNEAPWGMALAAAERKVDA